MTGPSREEFNATMDRMERSITGGFSGVHERLDDLNGRTRKGEVADAEVRAKIKNLEMEVFGRRGDDRPSAQTGSVFRSQDERGLGWFTRREQVLMGFGVGMIFALFKLVEWLGSLAFSAAIEAMKHLKP